MRRLPAALLAIVVLVACNDPADTSEPSQTSRGPSADAGLGDAEFISDLDDAVAVNLAGNGTDPPTVAWTTNEAVLTAVLDLARQGIGDAVDVSQGIEPIAHPIERPAVAVRADGSVDVAFTSFAENGSASVFHASGGTTPTRISGEPRPETNLVHMTLVGDSPVLAWLEDATLSVGIGGDGPITEREMVDDLTCDCCNPVPLSLDGSLVVAYRDYDTVDGQIVRNVAAVRSDDGAETFGETVSIADDDWFLNACPFSGPNVLALEDDLVVAWMDGRQSMHPDQTSTSIWVDHSRDGGTTFGPDIEVTSEGVNRWPVMAADGNDTIYLIWETTGTDGGLSYATSVDGGMSFDAKGLLVARAPGDGGAPKSPSAIVHGRHLLVTWADSVAGHVGSWNLGE